MKELQVRIEKWNHDAARLRQMIPAPLRCLPAVRKALAMQEEAADIIDALTVSVSIMEGRDRA